MKIKLDENLPGRLVSLLTDLGHDVDTVPAEGIAGKDDAVVWRAAQVDGRFFVTQDLDFSDVRKYTPGTHSRPAAGSVAAAGPDGVVRADRVAFSDRGRRHVVPLRRDRHAEQGARPKA